MTIADAAWAFDGTNLLTHAYSVRLLEEEGLPERRGENTIVPGVDGRTLTAKEYEERVLPLAMWVDGRGTAGGARSAAQLAANVNTLKSLFGADGTHTLTRTFGTTALQSTVEVRKFRITPAGPNHYTALAEMYMPDPMWYATGVTAGSSPFSAVPGTVTVANVGTYPAHAMTISVACSGTTVSITNPKIAIGDYWVKYTGVLTNGTLTITPQSFAADVGGNSVVSQISWNESNGPRWLALGKGTNKVIVSADGISNTPILSVTFYAPYL